MMEHLLTQENFAKLSGFIYRVSGIFLEYEKHYQKLANYIDTRASLLGLNTFNQYFAKLRFEDNDSLELQELINTITVNESYFFRENEQFQILIEHVLSQFDAQLPALEPIRILSAGCSTGEEAYSIVIHLLKDGKIVRNRDVEIVGVDIDSSVIHKAQLAHYDEYAVHALKKENLNRYFSYSNGVYELADDVRKRVQFYVGNVLNQEFMKQLGKFDVIFSRNMFIYFDDAARKKVVTMFYEMLNSNGYVFLGNAESMQRIAPIYKVHKIGNTCIYQR